MKPGAWSGDYFIGRGRHPCGAGRPRRVAEAAAGRRCAKAVEDTIAALPRMRSITSSTEVPDHMPAPVHAVTEQSHDWLVAVSLSSRTLAIGTEFYCIGGIQGDGLQPRRRSRAEGGARRGLSTPKRQKAGPQGPAFPSFLIDGAAPRAQPSRSVVVKRSRLTLRFTADILPERLSACSSNEIF